MKTYSITISTRQGSFGYVSTACTSIEAMQKAIAYQFAYVKNFALLEITYIQININEP